jgi:hypothetical protein
MNEHTPDVRESAQSDVDAADQPPPASDAQHAKLYDLLVSAYLDQKVVFPDE